MDQLTKKILDDMVSLREAAKAKSQAQEQNYQADFRRQVEEDLENAKMEAIRQKEARYQQAVREGRTFYCERFLMAS